MVANAVAKGKIEDFQEKLTELTYILDLEICLLNINFVI